MWFRLVIDAVFAAGLFINTMLFIPQSIKIIRKKTASDLSLTTFLGFCLTQLSAVIYGYLHNDYILMYGYILAFMTCGFVTFLIIIFSIKSARSNISE